MLRQGAQAAVKRRGAPPERRSRATCFFHVALLVHTGGARRVCAGAGDCRAVGLTGA